MVSFLQLHRDTQSYFWKQALFYGISEFTSYLAGVCHVQIFLAEQSCLIHQILPRSFSKVQLFSICMSTQIWQTDSFISSLCPRSLLVNKITETGFWSSSPSIDACQLRVRGPMCMVMKGHNCSLRQRFCVSLLPIWGPCVVHSHFTATMFPTSHFIAWMLASNSVHCIFSCAPTVLSWKLGGCRLRVSSVIKCDGVVHVFAHAFILNSFQCDIC